MYLLRNIYELGSRYGKSANNTDKTVTSIMYDKGKMCHFSESKPHSSMKSDTFSIGTR